MSKANTAGLTSPLQKTEMKSILCGAWPPLKPLPVFKYETVEYRATIDFDKKRGEWVCRKTSLGSNRVQELRGGLGEITQALPHEEAENCIEEAELQEQELEKDTNRRLQALQEWKKNYESGGLYFALRDALTESQQREVDDSLRLSLTARQLQFNAKNVAYVFDLLSTAGGRFATLIEFAKRNKTKEGSEPQAQEEGVVPEAESGVAVEKDKELLDEVCSRVSEGVPDERTFPDQEATECCSTAEELPAVSVKEVLPEQEQGSLAESTAPHSVRQSLEIESSEAADSDCGTLAEARYETGRSPAFAGFEAHAPAGLASGELSERSSSLRGVEISGFQVAVFAALFLSAAFAFIVGLTVGRGPFASRLREVPKSMLIMDDKSPAAPDAGIPAPAAVSSNAAGSGNRAGGAAPSEGKPGGNTRTLEVSAELKSKNSDVTATESKPAAKAEAGSEYTEGFAAGSRAPGRLTPTTSAAPHAPKATTILVTRPGRGSQAFRVNFPEKSIGATASLAMNSQLSVVVSAASGRATAHKPARLEEGELVSYVWPSYPRPGAARGLAETIRVRATIGPLGQVGEVKFLRGSGALLPATKAAIRQWRYRPTLLDKRPVQAQQEITIEVRPAQYSSQSSTQHVPHN